ncbi:histidine acid phosphatase [Sporothrix brasiliensis 5110]|uniref:Histidine acid phosphatase n=1 Tax=Sporothrix brasiliensis 5110 TaxID=1398154 RepID=A0A0C2J1F2_9PEZI|nr:histidine acid phosphatase [Sporothrix brasiliensis 5110]KIH95156.1 histidine acid phosphatase [Sporothrix brasiliensis 5110]
MAAHFTLPKSLLLALLAATAATPAMALDITVWSAVAFIMYGERTPLVGPTSPELTPLGAQQMFSQGTAFRNRYVLQGTANASSAADFPVYGLESNALDTNQVTVLSTGDSYVAAGALAFMQGLYPPQTHEYAYDNGGRSAAVLANGALVNFPLDGYQYPLVTTASLQDPASSWIQGNLACTLYQQSAIDYHNNNEAATLYNSTLGLYQSLWPTLFQTVFSETNTNFYFAYELYDYAAYMYNHDPQVANALNASLLEDLRIFASAQQRDLNANLTVSGKYTGDMIRAVTGRMLAQQVVNFFRGNILNSGASNKLSLMFGSFEPFVAFFALSGLLGGDDFAVFESLPGNGGAMVFELYSLSANDSTVANNTVYPGPSDLFVRFLYVPDTDADSKLTSYDIFNSTQVNIPYSAFASAMQGIGFDSVAVWCDTCDGVSVFCPGMLENAGYGDGCSSGSGSSGGGSGGLRSQSGGMAPAVAGVIGALVTLAVVGLAILAAMLLGGLRFFFAGGRRGSHGGNNGTDKSGIFKKRFSFGSGGFKGGERKMADADVAVSKTGVGHERVGSWELRNGSSAGNNAAAATSGTSAAGAADVESGEPATRTERVRSTIVNRDPGEDDDAIMADLGLNPVDPREHI